MIWVMFSVVVSIIYIAGIATYIGEVTTYYTAGFKYARHTICTTRQARLSLLWPLFVLREVVLLFRDMFVGLFYFVLKLLGIRL